MRLLKPKRKRYLATIPSVWLALLPCMGLGFWVRVDKLRKKRGIKKHDYKKIKQLAIMQARKELRIWISSKG